MRQDTLKKKKIDKPHKDMDPPPPYTHIYTPTLIRGGSRNFPPTHTHKKKRGGGMLLQNLRAQSLTLKMSKCAPPLNPLLLVRHACQHFISCFRHIYYIN